jgi:microcin C transport system substrate-binding protein
MFSTSDEAATSYGLVAETIEYPKDRSWAAFTLRPQARWHDGQPITADDVVFSFDILKSKGAPQYAAYWQDVAKAEKLDERVVKFTFRGGENNELPSIIGQLTVLPKHWWATRDFEKTSLEIPLGSGAYKVDSFEPGRFITVKGVEDAWARDLWMNRGRSNFDTIRYDYYRDETVAEAFKAGEVDYRESTPRGTSGHRLRHPRRQVRARSSAPTLAESTLPMQCPGFNLRRDLFMTAAAQAFVPGVDFEWPNKTLSYGLHLHQQLLLQFRTGGRLPSKES